MKQSGLEFKLGVFVLVAVALLVGMVMRAGDFSAKPGYTVRLIFDTAGGLDNSSPVRLAGVEVGEVKSIRVFADEKGETHAEVIAFIYQGVTIEEDSKMRVATMGFLGDKYVEIMPGTAGAKALEPGSLLVGKEYSSTDDLFAAGHRLIDKMQSTVDDMSDIVSDPAFKASVKDTFSEADIAMKNLAEASEDLKDTAKSAKIVMARLRDGEGTVGRLLKDDKVAKDLEAFTADIKAHPWKLLKRN